MLLWQFFLYFAILLVVNKNYCKKHLYFCYILWSKFCVVLLGHEHLYEGQLKIRFKSLSSFVLTHVYSMDQSPWKWYCITFMSGYLSRPEKNHPRPKHWPWKMNLWGTTVSTKILCSRLMLLYRGYTVFVFALSSKTQFLKDAMSVSCYQNYLHFTL